MQPSVGKPFFLTALILLCAGLIFGVWSSIYYIAPANGGTYPGFVALRPFHVSSMMFWILLGAIGAVYYGLQQLSGGRLSPAVARAQWALWLFAIGGIFLSYMGHRFGGREYWEFSPAWALPIALAWLLFGVNFAKAARMISRWPVYVWMWMTGILFFFFAFTENYLWLFPYFREHFVTDMTIQWKVNGSTVGAWNQLIYGVSFYLMERISKDSKVGHSRLAFAMYFLGLFNLMFNWGHHIYTVPTPEYVRYTGYLVSMTEWIIFLRIIYNWKSSLTDAQKHYHYFPYRFLMAADLWVFLNLSQALLMSIPALNLYTHGTHVTVAHAMGTTIGINTMILFAACFEFLGEGNQACQAGNRTLNASFRTAQGALLVFWLSLNIAGIQKGLWQMDPGEVYFREMMNGLRSWFWIFAASGLVLATALLVLAGTILRTAWRRRPETGETLSAMR
ncbi:MAG: cbb3-type cytochrome c oxidase subunit I [Saprospiraceae bacterium]